MKMKTVFRTVVCILVAVLLCGVLGGCGAGEVTEPVFEDNKTLHIGAWIAPPPGYITDENYQAVADTMKAEVLCNGATVNTYSIAVTAPQEQPTEPTASVPSSTPGNGGNLGIIIGLCVALAMLVIAIVVVLILCKKGILFGKGN